VKLGDVWLRGHLINHLAKKLSGEEGEAKGKQRVIHDLAANGLEANPCVINEEAQWYGKMAIRSD
jgi:hypothetical protein